MRNTFEQHFKLKEEETTFGKEVLAGFVAFFTVVYIIAVNSAILSEAGIPIEAAVLATIFTSAAGSILIGLWANAPMVLVPGMGVNAMFSYTIVQAMGLTWQQGLAVVFISGLFYTVIAFTPLTGILSRAIPDSLKDSITVGLGLFLALIGLEKGGIVQKGEHSILALGDIGEPAVLLSIVTLLIAAALFAWNVPANFLISIVIGTALSVFTGVTDMHGTGGPAPKQSGFGEVFMSMDFGNSFSMVFWIAVFSLTMVLVFENIGLVHNQVTMLQRPAAFTPAFRSNAFASMFSGIFGTSPTVSAVESAAAITAGGRTGITSITTGLLFLVSVFFIPYVKIIPDSAIAPVLIIIGSLMLHNIKNISFHDMSEGFPAFLVIIMIPFSYSIADGIGFGFIAYPVMKLLSGKPKEVSFPLYVIAGLFLINFIMHGMG
ncbi:NCS2 family permease [Bacillus marinisedimentorum]|uniref:NCS2 family permease n=1 Tax=Bacillus marinisedimentorum TaxID=1821260 RepID=UPI000871EC05|nr:NCS2 family permease [Bacillus marinisedimentorum]